MDKFKYGLVFALGSISIALSQNAISAPLTAAATIDWSQLQLEFTSLYGSESVASFSNYHTSLSSYAASGGMDESNSKSVNDWTSTTDTNADAGATHADALASALSFSGNVMSDGTASSSGTREVNFSVDGPGVLTVTVPYTLTLTGDSGNCYYCYYDHATVSGSASFYSNYTGTGGGYSNSNAYYSLTNDYWNPSPDHQAGTLVFGIVTNDAGQGSISVGFDLSTQTSMVPEPETYAMLLAGLMLIGRFARRKSTGVA